MRLNHTGKDLRIRKIKDKMILSHRVFGINVPLWTPKNLVKFAFEKLGHGWLVLSDAREKFHSEIHRILLFNITTEMSR